MSNEYLYAAFLAVIVFAAGFGTAGMMEDETQKDDTAYFVTSGSLQANSYEYGFNERVDLESPMRIRPLGGHDYVRENFIKTDAKMADLYYHDVDTVLDSRPETGIMPYQINVPKGYLAIYVRNGSDIEDPEDLDGKTLMPSSGTPSEVVDTSWLILEDEYDVDVTVLNETHSGASDISSPVRALKQQRADAAIITGDKRLNGSEGIRPVYYPYKQLRERFGAAALPTFLVVESDPNSIRDGEQMVEALNESASVAQSESDRFMEIFKICNEYLVTDGRPQIQEMQPETEKQLQYLVNLSAEEGIIAEKFSIENNLVSN